MIERTAIAISAVLAAALAAGPAAAQQQAAPLQVPAKSVPVSADVSPQMGKIIGLPLRTDRDIHPKGGAAWKPVAEAGAEALRKFVPGMIERLHVKVERTTIDGVRPFIVTPEVVPPENRNRVLVHETASTQ